jgi:hypothetical protein
MRFLPLLLLFASTVSAQVVATERDGTVTVEAEDFQRQSRDEVRRWYRVGVETLTIEPDGDPSHASSAAGLAYIEVLPDTRRTHDDKLIRGENFSPEPGKMAVIEYDIEFTTPGRYYVWVRAYSGGPEDNGVHVGLDGEWPESGQRMQWCKGKHEWTWGSAQRTEAVHCGEPGKIWLDVPSAGKHTVMFSMREDGFEMDRWSLTQQPNAR